MSFLLEFPRRIVQRENPSGPKVPRSEQHQGETQRQVIVTPDKSAPAEVRVIVQPIQPVFYMPRQSRSILPISCVEDSLFSP
jgi:hypothetical protein